MTMGMIAGMAIGLAAGGMTTDSERKQFRRRAGRFVRDMVD